MNIPGILGRTLRRGTRAPVVNVEALAAQADGIRAELERLETEITRLSGAGADYILENWAPRELQRLYSRRNELPPADGEKQAIAQGQINEILVLRDLRRDAEYRRKVLNAQLSDLATKQSMAQKGR